MKELIKNVHYSNDLEMQILGAIILEPTAFGRTFKIIDQDVFRNLANKEIYLTIAETWQKGLQIDHLTTLLSLEKKGFKSPENPNTAHYISQLTRSVTSTAALEYYCLLLREMYINREVIRLTTSGLKQTDGLNAVSQLETDLFKLKQKITVDDFKNFDEILVNLSYHMGEVKGKSLSGLTTGFKKLDFMTGGLQPGGMYIIGARPSVGKSAFMGKMVLMAALDNKQVAIISLEMTNNQIAARIASLSTDINYHSIYRNQLEVNQQNHFYKKLNEITSLPIQISDSTGVNISDIKAKVAKLKTKGKIDILYIDYLQLLDSDNTNKNYNREQEVSKISRGLKLLAKDNNIPVVVLAQLNRTSEQSPDKKPKLHHLRESGSLEQDADGVIFLHRDYMSGILLNADGNSTINEADIIIAKWRDGEINDIKIGFDGAKMKFYEFDNLNF
jgi:replicative DNA helicase